MFLDHLEQAFSVLVFTAEVGMRLFIAPISSKCRFSRWNYLCSFYGIVDLGSIAPWWVITLPWCVRRLDVYVFVCVCPLADIFLAIMQVCVVYLFVCVFV